MANFIYYYGLWDRCMWHLHPLTIYNPTHNLSWEITDNSAQKIMAGSIHNVVVSRTITITFNGAEHVVERVFKKTINECWDSMFLDVFGDYDGSPTIIPTNCKQVLLCLFIPIIGWCVVCLANTKEKEKEICERYNNFWSNEIAKFLKEIDITITDIIANLHTTAIAHRQQESLQEQLLREQREMNAQLLHLLNMQQQRPFGVPNEGMDATRNTSGTRINVQPRI